MKTNLLLIILFLSLQIAPSLNLFSTSMQKETYLSLNSDDEFDDEEGSEEEQENEEIEENA